MSDTVTIENPNATGRINSLVGLVGPHEKRDVSSEVAAAVCDGVNFRRVESSESIEPSRKPASRKSS